VGRVRFCWATATSAVVQTAAPAVSPVRCWSGLLRAARGGDPLVGGRRRGWVGAVCGWRLLPRRFRSSARGARLRCGSACHRKTPVTLTDTDGCRRGVPHAGRRHAGVLVRCLMWRRSGMGFRFAVFGWPSPAFADSEMVTDDRMLPVNGWVRDNWWVRQLSLFDRATTTAMRDRTRSRNYSPERDEFRRDHERRRYWGLKRRHAEKLRQIHGDRPPPTTPPANDDRRARPTPTPTPPAVPAPVAATPPPVSSEPAAPAPRPAHPRVTASPVAAAPTAAQSATKKRIQPPRGSRRHSAPPVTRRQQFNGENHSGHETYAISSITRSFAHPQKARAPPRPHPPFHDPRGGRAQRIALPGRPYGNSSWSPQGPLSLDPRVLIDGGR